MAQSGLTRDQAAKSLGIAKSYVDSVCTGRRVCTNEMACLVQLWPSDGSLVQAIVQNEGGVCTKEPETEGVVVQTQVQTKAEASENTGLKPSEVVVYKSGIKDEWDIMADGYARGFPKCPPVVRFENQTAFAYFRIIYEQTGFDIFTQRITRKEFDAVDWQSLGLPRFDHIGKIVRDRLPESKKHVEAQK